jgi:hypothetical protein
MLVAKGEEREFLGRVGEVRIYMTLGEGVDETAQSGTILRTVDRDTLDSI